MKKKSKLQKKGFFTKVFKAFQKDCKQAKEFIGTNPMKELDKMFRSCEN